MAIGYTELDFINGAAPALNAANLNHIDEGVAAIGAVLDSPSGLAACVQDATTAAKGVVMLASTGTQSATKVPKATGAELAALLTAGGFSLSPAEGADNLDNIADGATYKRILAAVATALNAGTYDAAKCTAFGIGTTAVVSKGTGTAIDSAVLGGNFYCTNPVGVPANVYALIIIPVTSTLVRQRIVGYDSGKTYERLVTISAGPTYTPDAWYEQFNAQTDGNGGQPPAPKPKGYSSYAIGEAFTINSAENGALSLPAGGKWAYIVMTRAIATGVMYNFGGAAGVAGGSGIKSASGVGNVHMAFIWRTE